MDKRSLLASNLFTGNYGQTQDAKNSPIIKTPATNLQKQQQQKLPVFAILKTIIWCLTFVIYRKLFLFQHKDASIVIAILFFATLLFYIVEIENDKKWFIIFLCFFYMFIKLI